MRKAAPSKALLELIRGGGCCRGVCLGGEKTGQISMYSRELSAPRTLAPRAPRKKQAPGRAGSVSTLSGPGLLLETRPHVRLRAPPLRGCPGGSRWLFRFHIGVSLFLPLPLSLKTPIKKSLTSKINAQVMVQGVNRGPQFRGVCHKVAGVPAWPAPGFGSSGHAPALAA